MKEVHTLETIISGKEFSYEDLTFGYTLTLGKFYMIDGSRKMHFTYGDIEMVKLKYYLGLYGCK